MKATFTKAIRYWVEAVCQTPLRTGEIGRAPEQVMRNWQGRAVIQGSSLAGALRNWLASTGNTKLAGRLFGATESAGTLMVSDGLFAADAEQTIRPGLRINRACGSADLRGRVDVAHICTGARFEFTLTWLGSEETEEEADGVERMLTALHAGEIRLGAKKSNGFGRVALTVRKQEYDLRQAEARDAWLEDRWEGQPLPLPEMTCTKWVIFTLTGQADNILVKGPAPEHMESESWIRNLQEDGRPVIPGSSIKGAVRARAEAIGTLKGIPGQRLEELFGKSSEGGGNEMAGIIRFEDAILSPDRTRKITRIRINRFTAGVIRGGLYQEEPVCTSLQIRIAVPADCALGCGLVLYALRDLGLGLYSLGSGEAIGRGRISARELRAETPGGQSAILTFDAHGSLSASDPAGLFQTWQKEVRA